MLTLLQPSDCARARAAASARLDGELSELEAAWLDAHLGGCADCGAFVDGMAGSAAALRAATLEQPAFRVDLPRRRHPLPAVAAGIAAAAALVIAVSGSFSLGRVLGGHGSARPAATSASDLLILREVADQQHLLALLNTFHAVEQNRSRMQAV